MLLVQHPQHIPMSPSLMPIRFNSHIHRRNPSAPAAVVHVQATKVPGLLLALKASAAASYDKAKPRRVSPRQSQRPPLRRQTSSSSSNSEGEGVLRKIKRQGRSPTATSLVKLAEHDCLHRSSSKPRAGHGRRAHQPSLSHFLPRSRFLLHFQLHSLL